MSMLLQQVAADGVAANPVSEPLDVLVVCSSGGHLAQFDSLRAWWSGHRTRWVTFRTPDAECKLRDQDVHWAHHPTTRNLKNALLNLGMAVAVVVRHRPDVIVSNGAGVAYPFFVVAWILRVPTVYVEVYDRIDTATLTGRLCRPLASTFCVQWEEQLRHYPGATVVGHLL